MSKILCWINENQLGGHSLLNFGRHVSGHVSITHAAATPLMVVALSRVAKQNAGERDMYMHECRACVAGGAVSMIFFVCAHVSAFNSMTREPDASDARGSQR